MELIRYAWPIWLALLVMTILVIAVFQSGRHIDRSTIEPRKRCGAIDGHKICTLEAHAPGTYHQDETLSTRRASVTWL